jgi:glutathione synthase/RimK-type ligase-like ATP-grasp enzyme
LKKVANKIAVIGRDFHPDGKETASSIAEALRPFCAKNGLATELVLFKDILFDISTERIEVLHMPSGQSLSEYSVVLMTNWFSHASVRKDMAYSLALYFEKQGIPCLNSEALHSRSSSKLSQMMMAALKNVAIPRTIFCLSPEHLIDYLQAARFEVPFIFKDAQASRGNGNYLLKSVDEIRHYASQHSEKHPFMAQQFIAADNADYRFFVVGGRPRLVIKRMGKGDSHLNNTSQGAKTEVLEAREFSDETLGMVDTMCHALGREVTGIDIMFDKTSNQPYFLEANPIPQIATGSNVELKLTAVAEAMRELSVGGNS